TIERVPNSEISPLNRSSSRISVENIEAIIMAAPAIAKAATLWRNVLRTYQDPIINSKQDPIAEIEQVRTIILPPKICQRNLIQFLNRDKNITPNKIHSPNALGPNIGPNKRAAEISSIALSCFLPMYSPRLLSGTKIKLPSTI